MKKIAILFIVVAGLVACSSSDKKPVSADPTKLTSILWVDSTYLDLGKQKEGKEIEVSFRFKNTGTNNLIIQNVSAQCGCTVPQKPEQPFAPGEEGVIKAKYNGSGHGETRKEIYVSANTTPATTQH